MHVKDQTDVLSHVHARLGAVHAVFATALGNAQDKRWPNLSMGSGVGEPPPEPV